jgi:hypothetical protein
MEITGGHLETAYERDEREISDIYFLFQGGIHLSFF